MIARVTRRALLGGLAGAAAGAAMPAPVARTYDPASLTIKFGGIEIPSQAVEFAKFGEALASARREVRDLGLALGGAVIDDLSAEVSRRVLDDQQRDWCNSDPFWPTWWLIFRRSVRPLFMVQCDDTRDAHLAGGEPERWVRPWSRRAAQDPVWHRLLARLCREAWPGTSGGRWVLYMPDGSVVEREP